MIKNKLVVIFKSLFNSRELFRLRKERFYFPLLSFVLLIIISLVPGIIDSYNKTGAEIVASFPNLNNALNELFTNENYLIDCKIENKELVCAENASLEFSSTEFEYNGKNTSYKVLVNTVITNQLEEPSASNTTSYDNYIYFSKNGLEIRFINDRNYSDESVSKIIFFGTYDRLEGFSFLQEQNKIQNMSDLTSRISYSTYLNFYIIKQINDTMNRGYALYYFISIFGSFTTYILLSSLILKGNNLFNGGKGFKFKESIKIATFASLQSALISLFGWLILSFDYIIIFSLSYLARIIYLYIRYLFKKNSVIFSEIEKGLL